MIEVRGVSKAYGNTKVVDDVSLEFARGSMTSIIGPNGAGKSTLLSLISRLLPADAGEIFIDGQDIKRYKSVDLAKKISVLKQSNHINVRLTVRELVVFGRFPYSQGRFTADDWEHADRAIAYVGLQHLQNKYIDQLSGGERQRAFLAMVIAQNTDCILLDEPLNNLDMKQAVQVMKTLRKLVDECGKTIIVVIHDINFASFYSDYIVAMKDGKVVQSGPTGQMICDDILTQVYDMQVRVRNIDSRQVCLYFV